MPEIFLIEGISNEPTITDFHRAYAFCAASKKAVEFYAAAFGANELFRIENNESVVARLTVGSAEFWVADESPEHKNFSPESLGGGTVRILLMVEDPDAIFQQAVSAGASAVSPVSNQHGWRFGRVADPFGHHWEIGKELNSSE